jgi:hypothetical protein
MVTSEDKPQLTDAMLRSIWGLDAALVEAAYNGGEGEYNGVQFTGITLTEEQKKLPRLDHADRS